MSLYMLLILVVAGQGLLLFAMMIFRGRKKFSEIALSILVLFFSYHVFYIFLINSGFITQVPFLIATCFAFQTLIPVLFYWYIIKGNNRSLDKSDYWHFLPFAVHLAFWVPFFIMSPEMKLGIIQGEIENPTYKVIGFKGGVILQMALFTYYAVLLLRFKVDSKNTWTIKCKNAFILMSGIFIADGIFYLIATAQYFPIFHLILAGIIYFLAYHSFNHQKEVFTKPKYENGKLEPGHLNLIMMQVEEYMVTEKPHLNQDLRIRDISENIGWSEADISQAINSSKDMSFRDFINSYRIEVAKQILMEDQLAKHKNLAIAFSSGFNNKVSFYKSFTKFVGMTPKEFRESVHPEPNSLAS